MFIITKIIWKTRFALARCKYTAFTLDSFSIGYSRAGEVIDDYGTLTNPTFAFLDDDEYDMYKEGRRTPK